MRQRRDRPRFGLEPPAHLRVGRDVVGHHLDGDIPVEPRVPRAIHLAHAAGADGRNDFVLRQARPGGEIHDYQVPRDTLSWAEVFFRLKPGATRSNTSQTPTTRQTPTALHACMPPTTFRILSNPARSSRLAARLER